MHLTCLPPALVIGQRQQIPQSAVRHSKQVRRFCAALADGQRENTSQHGLQFVDKNFTLSDDRGLC